jgi:hypothetical protein
MANCYFYTDNHGLGQASFWLLCAVARAMLWLAESAGDKRDK